MKTNKPQSIPQCTVETVNVANLKITTYKRGTYQAQVIEGADFVSLHRGAKNPSVRNYLYPEVAHELASFYVDEPWGSKVPGRSGRETEWTIARRCR